MLPRAESFKEILFIPRIVAFNESFVPLGKSKLPNKIPIAIIWHEGITGRSKEDIISTFFAFFIHKRDDVEITIWLDNCAAQNKNWAFLCFLLYLINSAETNFQKICIKYFEPGHTFMSADSFHHQVEKSLQKKGKVWDFEDYKECVQSANSRNVKVIDMKLEDFYVWKDYASKTKLKKITPKLVLRNIVEVKVVKNCKEIFFKKHFNEEYEKLNFLIAKHAKSGLSRPLNKTQPNGITNERKQQLLKLLKNVIPTNRFEFWEKMPVRNNYNSDDSSDENEETSN